MKLVDILARELKVWPEGLECLSQLKGTGYIINGKGFDGRAFDALQIADETLVAGAIVTRAEWQAAVDALNQSELDAVLAKNEQLAAARAERIPVWNGEGLPPVGIECEWHPNVHGWVKVKILGRDGSDTWYRASGEEHSQTCRNMAFFRPIRTADQVAAEEREKAAKELYMTINWDSKPGTWENLLQARRDDYRKAIDAGYRKEPIPCGS